MLPEIDEDRIRSIYQTRIIRSSLIIIALSRAYRSPIEARVTIIDGTKVN